MFVKVVNCVGTSSKSGSNWLTGIEKWIILERLERIALISLNITLHIHLKDTFIGFTVNVCTFIYSLLT